MLGHAPAAARDVLLRETQFGNRCSTSRLHHRKYAPNAMPITILSSWMIHSPRDIVAKPRGQREARAAQEMPRRGGQPGQERSKGPIRPEPDCRFCIKRAPASPQPRSRHQQDIAAARTSGTGLTRAAARARALRDESHTRSRRRSNETKAPGISPGPSRDGRAAVNLRVPASPELVVQSELEQMEALPVVDRHLPGDRIEIVVLRPSWDHRTRRGWIRR